ncbi:hypothetical protein TCE0_060f18606 [Talaromyces pinophilus]|uniref:Peptidase A2 domain-containing protein n=1 Tax=Talaromyces pinophilus TaxID=128442 RepID=A0A6V8HNV0_TALPI|nr:hypothetical protein TCE0_060f18606 [Talaromyces pinophilus]
MAEAISLATGMIPLLFFSFEAASALHATFENLRHTKEELAKSKFLMAPANLRHKLAKYSDADNVRKDFSSGSRQYFVDGYLNGVPVEALPDTGADMCFISKPFASSFGLTPVTGTQKRIFLANKKSVLSPGMVEMPWKFMGERKTHTLNCWILPGCIYDLVLGSDFLRATKTLTKYARRIKSKLVSLPKRLQLHLLGKESHRLMGYLDGYLTAAFPDTGSDVMLISKDYVKRLGLAIDRDFENWLEIELGDGTTAWTEGIVRNVSWNVGGNSIFCDFHVLDDLCVDVVLSNNYLFELNVFSECSKHFFTNLEEDVSHLCNIRLIGRYADSLNLLEEEYLADICSPDAFGAEKLYQMISVKQLIYVRLKGNVDGKP